MAIVFYAGELYLKGNCLKLTKLRNVNHKKFQIYPTSILFPPGEIYGTYAEVDDDLKLNISIHNAPVARAHA